jgi:methylthioribose-1-phosphate isomerase
MSLRVDEYKLKILDQQLLPFEEKWIEVQSPDHMVEIIQSLKVRGAPLIGVAAALSLATWACEKRPSEKEFLKEAEKLRASRPTAVNLMNALDRVVAAARGKENFYNEVYEKACEILEEDIKLCESMGKAGSEVVKKGDQILTHCNTGGLATAGRGTALGVISYAWEQNKNIHVYVDETRPLLQGGRLTVWELSQLKIPHTLICDNMAGFLMAQGKVDKVFVGTDRIALNGDFANKIGTFSVAVLAKYHNIPFYVVAPSTTVDAQCESGKDIPIEERKDFEVKGVEGSFGKTQWAMDTVVYNPAFDMTPVDLVTGIIIDDRLYSRDELKRGELKKQFSPKET